MITPIYASLLTFMFIFLSFRTLGLRRKLKIGIGNGEDESLLRAIRVHSNFIEYTPLALLLSLMLELAQTSTLLVHFVCLILLLGRIIHAYGVSNTDENYKFRVTGMTLTFTSLITSAAVLLYLSLFGHA